MKKNQFSFTTLMLPMGLLLLAFAGVGASANTLHLGDLAVAARFSGDPKVAVLAATVQDLKSLKLSASRSIDKDDLEVDAIPASDWWSYLSARADRFELDGDKCHSGAIAYIVSELPGVIHLCEIFYSQSRIDRIQVLLHEVRHFDGFDHTMCSRGSSLGTRGACDESIQQKGSYAVSLQASVAVALRGENFSDAERAMARASALYLAENRFNEEARIKLKETLYLENENGTVYEADPKTPEHLNRITQLNGPGQLYSIGTEVTVFPYDRTQNAYRMSDDFTRPSKNIGIFANSYNAAPVEARARIENYNYVGRGGFVVDGAPRLHCPEGMLAPFETLPERVTNAISLKGKTYFLGASGNLHFGWCAPSERVYFDQPTQSAPVALKRVVEIGNEIFVLSEGQVYRSQFNDGRLSLIEPLNIKSSERWIEMTKRTMPVLFEPLTSYKSAQSY